MKKQSAIFLSVTTLFLTISVSAGQHVLDWHVERLQADTLTQHIFTFNHAVTDHQTALWYPIEVDETSDVKITNAVYEDCSEAETDLLRRQGGIYPASGQTQRILSSDKKQLTATLMLPAVIVEDNRYKKLLSFDSHTVPAAVQASTTINAAARYTANSVLRTGKWVKISVPTSGIYKLTYEQLAQAGISPADVRVFGYGGALLEELFSETYTDDLPEVAIYMHKGSDNTFNAGDYILFYAQGPVSWQYNMPTGASQKMFSHTQNFYATQGCYFITSDAGTGKRINLQAAVEGTPNDTVTTFTDYIVHEQDALTLIESGRELFGELFDSNTGLTRRFQIDLPNIQAAPAALRINAVAKGDVTSVLNIAVNQSNLGGITFSPPPNTYTYAVDGYQFMEFTPLATNRIDVVLTYDNHNSGRAWLNYFELNVTRALSIVGNDPLFFRTPKFVGQKNIHHYIVDNASAATQIWNITDPLNIKQMTTSLVAGTLNFADSTTVLQEYVAINPTIGFPAPTIIGTVANQNLHALPQTEMVIITHADFIAQAERLADIHRSYDDMQVQVIDAQKIYNEFSSGVPDATAYRRFMKMFYDRALTPADQPDCLLLFGDASFDNRGILKETPPNTRRLLAFQSLNSLSKTASYVSDDYFGFLDDGEGKMLPSDQLDLSIGRFPVYTVQQAVTVVDKTLKYLQNDIKGNWKNSVLFIGDDGDGTIHVYSADSAARVTARKNSDAIIRKLYLDAYKQETSAVGERYPAVKKQFDDYIKSGVLMVNYMGHGGYAGWTNEAILTLSDIINMYNEKYPLFVTATCDFTGYDAPYDTGGEQLLWNTNGGTMALVTTTRTVFTSPNLELNRLFSENIFAKDSLGDPLHLGEVMRRAKNAQKNTNKFSFTLIGDPALRLSYPCKYKITTDSINHVAVNVLSRDTVTALSEVTISGHVRDLDSLLMSQFNGIVHISVFDKEVQVTTLCNDKESSPFTYKDRPNPIFNGQAVVQNGQFTVTFMLPKDIQYNFGTGRIVYYAADETNDLEANGSFEQFIIGGESDNIPFDDRGPDVMLYLNSGTFVSGATVNESPLLVAEVFDESGINTVGSGIGHDIILRLDNNPASDIILNNHYQAMLGSYKAGRVTYPFSNLAEGNYELMFRVWDLQNNSTTKTIHFKVVKGTAPELEDMYAYPNPATEEVTFVYQHNRPQAPLSITATVFDLSGRKVWQSSKNVIADGNTTAITWHFAAEGVLLNTGMYLVRMDLSAAGGDSVSKTKKLIINTQ
ncbi:MAG: type IX secretion system sortase PorU [Prevotellaceae bacterium]|jgi:hypothetical protein|nr:type IX secretion system sortase PorU [Prevotellaceae bacterium]